MSESILNILDNSCTKPSPCRNCPNHRAGINKRYCIPHCEALAAYQAGLPYQGLPYPKITEEMIMTDLELDDLEEQELPEETKKSVVKSPPKRKYHKATVTPASPIPQMRGLLTKEAGGKCCIDGCDSKHKLIRGLCNKHYQQWREGHLKHPVLGIFSTWQGKSKVPSQKQEREKSITTETVPDIKPKGALGSILIDPPFGINKGQSKTEKPYPSPDEIVLDFTNYQRIKKIITKKADKFALPVEHVIMSLIAGAVARVTEKI